MAKKNILIMIFIFFMCVITIFYSVLKKEKSTLMSQESDVIEYNKAEEVAFTQPQEPMVIDPDLQVIIRHLSQQFSFDDLKQENLARTLNCLIQNEDFKNLTDSHGILLGQHQYLLDRLISVDHYDPEDYIIFLILVEYKVQWYTNPLTWDEICSQRVQDEMQNIRENECMKLKTITLSEWAESLDLVVG